MAIAKDSYCKWTGSDEADAQGRVTHLINDGTVPDVPEDIEGTEEEPAARLEIYQEVNDGWMPSGEFTGQLVSTLQEIDNLEPPTSTESKSFQTFGKSGSLDIPDESIEAGLRELLNKIQATRINQRRSHGSNDAIPQGLLITVDGKPTPDDLAKINKFTPVEFPPLQVDEVAIVTLLVSNNLLTYDLKKWAIESLQIMPASIIGKQAMLNHDLDDCDTSWGKVFDAQYLALPSASPDVINKLPEQLATNLAIVAKEGYHCCFARIYVKADHPILEDIRFGRKDRVSLGCFSYSGLRCPDCICPTGWQYEGPSCFLGLAIPDPGWGVDPATDPLVAKYAERFGLLSAEEVSFVGAGNIPAAGTVKP